MTTTVTERLAEFAVSLRWQDVPERVRELARVQLVNVIASLYPGAVTDAGGAVRRMVARHGAPGPCTIIPTGDKVSLRDAVLANGAFAMALDYDDYLYMGHTGHSAVIGSLAIAEAEGLTMRDVLLGQVIANEVGGRVGASTVLGPQNGQAWSFLHAAAGAALAARLYGLSRAQAAHAIAIALYQPTYTLWPGFMGPQSKVLTAAGPTITGIEAAQLAREGLTGALDIFEHPRKGFWAAFTFAPLPGMMTGLGTSWVSDTLAYKRYPGCAYIDTTMDALFAALDQHRRHAGRALRADEVEGIAVRASLLTVEMDNLAAEHVGETGPLSPVNINFSIPLNVALGVIAGRHTGHELQQPFLDEHDQPLRALARRVTLAHDWPMTFAVVRAFDGVLGASSPVRQLRPGDYLRVLAGYLRHLGGRRKHPLDLGRLLPTLARALMRGGRGGRGGRGDGGGDGDLATVDFSRFAVTFPAEVTITTRGGARYTARQDVPVGGPGQPGRRQVVEDKLRVEARGVMSEERVEAALRRFRRPEDASVADVIAAACGAAHAAERSGG